MKRFSPLLLPWILLPAVAWAADDPVLAVRSYVLPGHGSIELKVPSSWRESVHQPPSGLPPTIEFSPTTGQGFKVLVTPLWGPDARPGFNKPEAIREMLESTGRERLDQAVEKEITFREIQGPESVGYAFTLTDRAPKAGEWVYATSGAVGLGDLLLMFTILTNRLDDEALRQGLSMIESSVLARAPLQEPPPAPPSSLRKLTYPGKKWSLVLDLPGFEFETRQTRPDMTGVMVFGGNQSTGVLVSIFLEKADYPGDAKAFREAYWRKTRKARPAAKDVRFSERGEMALVERTIERVQNVEINHRHLNALLSHDGVWIDIHLSKVKFQPGDQRLFDAILDTVVLADPETSARPAPAAAASRAGFPPPISLPVPGRDWSLVIDTLGATLSNTPEYSFEKDGIRVTSQRVVGWQFEGGSDRTGLAFLIKIKEDAGEGDSVSLRDRLWKENRLSLGGRPREVQLYERGDWAFVDYRLPKIEGRQVDLRSVIACLRRDGIVITMDWFKADYRPEDDSAFEAVLGSIRIAEGGPTRP